MVWLPHGYPSAELPKIPQRSGEAQLRRTSNFSRHALGRQNRRIPKAGNVLSNLNWPKWVVLSPGSDCFQKGGKSSALETFESLSTWVSESRTIFSNSSPFPATLTVISQPCFSTRSRSTGSEGVIGRWKRHSSISGQMNDPRIAHTGDPNHRAVDLPQDADSSGARIKQTDAIHLWGWNEICLKRSALTGSKSHFDPFCGSLGAQILNPIHIIPYLSIWVCDFSPMITKNCPEEIFCSQKFGQRLSPYTSFPHLHPFESAFQGGGHFAAAQQPPAVPGT